LGRGGERGRALRWGGLLAVVGLGLAGVAPARADASRVVLFYGDPGPFAELLAAELALVEGELRPGPIPAPRDGLEAQALRAELDAFAVIRALPAEIVLWVPGAEGQLRELRLRPHDDPGMAPLILAETIRAAPEWRTPSLPPRVAEPVWVRPPPRLARPDPPAPRRDDQRPAVAPPRWRLGLGVAGAWQSSEPFAPGATLRAALRLHPALELGAWALATGTPAGAVVVRVRLPVGPADLGLEAGPALWWLPDRTDNPTASLRLVPAWTAGLGVVLPVHRWLALEAHASLLRRGPRSDRPDARNALLLTTGLALRL